MSADRTPTIRGIHHVQITIPRGAEADGRRFYCDVLGLPETPKPAALRERGGFWLRVGDRDVHIGTEDGIDRTATKAHIALEVADIIAWRAHLTAVGVTIVAAVPIPGFERFEIRDPFGNRLEFIHEILPHSA